MSNIWCCQILGVWLPVALLGVPQPQSLAPVKSCTIMLSCLLMRKGEALAVGSRQGQGIEVEVRAMSAGPGLRYPIVDGIGRGKKQKKA